MFIRKLNIYRKNIALTLLIALTSVFVCDFLCDVGIMNNSVTHGNDSHHSHEVVASEDHHKHSHDHESAPSEMDTAHGESQDEDCCEEETNKLYASLVKHEIPKFDLDQELVLYTVLWISLPPISFNHKEKNPHRLNSALSPPIGGYFARILFQSFLL
ncbi:MAG: hypothetical protein R8N23_19910 [Reichenbachiella sp.]|uniref:hypothetical protein n=1 Tax=Reichenbachiella sp. TaxID=2184521 RepID=UPI00296648F0|nr:hypothetical protein [Reichenbachiella sp.]MDW3212145.1 hypothetical protein [Reichenbachiella sp.]